jgi:hypothetical protein
MGLKRPSKFQNLIKSSVTLGQWVNRQRSAHAKGCIKEEYVNQLEAKGLKWAILAQNKSNKDYDVYKDNFVRGDFIKSSSTERSNVTLLSNGYDPAQRNTASNDIPPLLSTSSGFVKNLVPKYGINKTNIYYFIFIIIVHFCSQVASLHFIAMHNFWVTELQHE